VTTPAWLMLGATWAVILYFTVRFFWMVLRLPERSGEPPPDEVAAGKGPGR